MECPFKRANILIPKNIDMIKWSVIACDQYTSEYSYWEEVETIVGNVPSTLRIMLPEIYLNDSDISRRIEEINNNMIKYLDEDLFYEYKNTMIYVERKLRDGKIREGLIGLIDLEDYSYINNSNSLIRATEETVVDRIPPRLKIRENASLELPHIMLLIDDNKKDIIEKIKLDVTDEDLIYDFDLMLNSGHVKGYKLNDQLIDRIQNKINKCKKDNLLFLMGDGNHSLATAKANYEKIKFKLEKEEYLNHPSRYALVELVNLHSDTLLFEPIHRVVFDINVDNLLDELYKYYELNEFGNGQYFEIVTENISKKLYILNPKNNIAVGSVQRFLDDYLSNNEGKIDYIHDDKKAIELGIKKGNIAFLFKPIEKDELFKTIVLDGILPRKTFSMGCSYDKRFYLESRKILK